MGPRARTAEHLARSTRDAEQLERARALREPGRGGFPGGPACLNTFEAHRLLHWAGLEGRQRELKHALLQAYHGQGENPGAHDVLIRLAGEVGLDAEQAREVLASGRYAAEVRAEERRWQELGINSVPSVIVDGQYLIQGGQPPAVFEQALREIAGQPAQAAP
jgi:predicted DsbA family dithiol-disulfide isomerase